MVLCSYLLPIFSSNWCIWGCDSGDSSTRRQSVRGSDGSSSWQSQGHGSSHTRGRSELPDVRPTHAGSGGGWAGGQAFLACWLCKGWVGQNTSFKYRTVNFVCIYKTKVLSIGYECLGFQASSRCLRTFLLSIRWRRRTRK